jgi:hypothetical protein
MGRCSHIGLSLRTVYAALSWFIDGTARVEPANVHEYRPGDLGIAPSAFGARSRVVSPSHGVFDRPLDRYHDTDYRAHGPEPLQWLREIGDVAGRFSFDDHDILQLGQVATDGQEIALRDWAS